MPRWQESWAAACLIYFAAAFWAQPALPQWVPPMLVAIAWHSGPVRHIKESIRSRTVALAVMSTALQVAITGLSVLAFLGRARLTAIHYLAAAALIAGAAIVVALCERRSTQPSPLYGLEGLVMVCFSAGYLVAMGSPSPAGRLFALMMLHTGILGVVVLRNSHLEAERIEGPVAESGYVKEVWRVRVREPGGARAVFAALSLPSGILGSALVVGELVLLLVLRQT